MSQPINAAILEFAQRVVDPTRLAIAVYPGGGEVKHLSAALLAAVEKIGEAKLALQLHNDSIDTRILILEAALRVVKREITERSDVTDGREGRQMPNQAMELETLLIPIIDAALTKNPNPSGHVLAEASTGESQREAGAEGRRSVLLSTR